MTKEDSIVRIRLVRHDIFMLNGLTSKEAKDKAIESTKGYMYKKKEELQQLVYAAIAEQKKLAEEFRQKEKEEEGVFTYIFFAYKICTLSQIITVVFFKNQKDLQEHKESLNKIHNISHRERYYEIGEQTFKASKEIPNKDLHAICEAMAKLLIDSYK